VIYETVGTLLGFPELSVAGVEKCRLSRTNSVFHRHLVTHRGCAIAGCCTG
jgi:hypothetical protein